VDAAQSQTEMQTFKGDFLYFFAPSDSQFQIVVSRPNIVLS